MPCTRRSSLTSATSVSGIARLILIPILLASMLSSLADLSAPSASVNASPTGFSASNVVHKQPHAPDLRDESA